MNYRVLYVVGQLSTGTRKRNFVRSLHIWGIHLRRDTVIPQWFQASKAAAASDGHAVHC